MKGKGGFGFLKISFFPTPFRRAEGEKRRDVGAIWLRMLWDRLYFAQDRGQLSLAAGIVFFLGAGGFFSAEIGSCYVLILHWMLEARGIDPNVANSQC